MLYLSVFYQPKKMEKNKATTFGSEPIVLIEPDLNKHSLFKAFKQESFDFLNQLNASMDILTELNCTHQRLWNLEDHARSKNATNDRIAFIKRGIDGQNGKRHQLINQFDNQFQLLCRNNTEKKYTETPGELCDRLIIQLLKYNHAFELQNKVDLPIELRIKCIQKVKSLEKWSLYLQECLFELLNDIADGKAVLPPRSEFKMYNEPLLNPITRAESAPDKKIENNISHNLEKVNNIIGIACTGHGASLSYISKKGIARSSVLDRQLGTKHTLMFSEDELKDILSRESSIDQTINKILTYSYRGFPAHQTFESCFPNWMSWLLKDLEISPKDIDLVVTSESHFVTSSFRLGRELNRWFPNAEIVIDVEHHVLHQRQAFWQSGFEEAAVLTIDTCGEQLDRLDRNQICGTISSMNRNGNHEIVKEFLFPHSSIGVIYALVNHHLGFKQGQEGKTMGLSAFGNDEFYKQLKPYLTLFEDGSFSLVNRHKLKKMMMDYVPAREYSRTAVLTDRHKNIAFAGQALLEDILKNVMEAALRLTGQKNLVYAGGVALNSVANEIAIRHAKPEKVYISPNPSDTGQSLGAALFGAFDMSGWPVPLKEMSDYLGPTYNDEEIESAVNGTKHHFEKTDDIDEKVAQCLANGYIVGRFSGGAEFGPRALGNRSILADPRRVDMKDYLNSKVKHREGFRPFAPSILAEHTSDWFELKDVSPYMLRVVPVLEEKKEQVPAIVHVDGTARVQTVLKENNEAYWNLIQAFYKITNVPIVVNTSFNVAGKPIVETPEQAIECFEQTDIDIVFFDQWIISKKPLNNYLNQPR
jgi:carbamoyltransferase